MNWSNIEGYCQLSNIQRLLKFSLETGIRREKYRYRITEYPIIRGHFCHSKKTQSEAPGAHTGSYSQRRRLPNHFTPTNRNPARMMVRLTWHLIHARESVTPSSTIILQNLERPDGAQAQQQKAIRVRRDPHGSRAKLGKRREGKKIYCWHSIAPRRLGLI